MGPPDPAGRQRPHANPDVPNEEIPCENMADCFSGAFLVYADSQGYIDAVHRVTT